MGGRGAGVVADVNGKCVTPTTACTYLIKGLEEGREGGGKGRPGLWNFSWYSFVLPLEKEEAKLISLALTVKYAEGS